MIVDERPESRLFTVALMVVGLAGCDGSLGSLPDNTVPDETGASGDSDANPGNGDSEPQEPDCQAGNCEEPQPDPCINAIPTPSARVSRLSHEQYQNTLRALLMLPVDADDLTDTVDGGIDANLAGDYRQEAETIATGVAHDAAALSRILNCDPGEGDACAHQFIEELGARAYRRPLTADESLRYQALYDRRGELFETDSFENGIELLLTAILQSPHFLQRVETSHEEGPGGRIALTGYEMASRLSYTLWRTMPDDQLFAAAAAGELSTVEQVGAQVDRMLADDRARETITRFHEEWLKVEEVDLVLDQDGSENISPSFRSSMRRWLQHVLFEEDGTLETLMTSPTVFVDDTLASLYGVDAGSGEDMASFADPSQRAGILTQPLILAAHINPVHRGLYIHRYLLCSDIPAPPPLRPDVEEALSESSEGGRTRRERIETAFGEQPCKGCHDVINPPGFALENYDRLGRFRSEDGGLPVDASGEINLDGTPLAFDDAMDFSFGLAESDTLQECYAEHWARFVFETQEPDLCMVDPLVRALGADDYGVSSVLRAAMVSDVMRFRSVQGWED